MEELVLLRFLEKYELIIYGVFGTVGVFYLFRLFISWRDWRGSVFGLERESAQRRFSMNMTAVILLVLLMMAEFILVSFVTPSLPQTSVMPTPTLDLLATPTVTLEPGVAQATPTAGVIALATIPAGACEPGKIEWIEPSAGSEISGLIDLVGTVNVPDFGFYKYEVSTPGSDTWTTIAVGDKPVTNDRIGSWNTSFLTPGDYLLRLVAINSQNQPLPACVIQVRVFAPSE